MRASCARNWAPSVNLAQLQMCNRQVRHLGVGSRLSWPGGGTHPGGRIGVVRACCKKGVPLGRSTPGAAASTTPLEDDGQSNQLVDNQEFVRLGARRPRATAGSAQPSCNRSLMVT